MIPDWQRALADSRVFDDLTLWAMGCAQAGGNAAASFARLAKSLGLRREQLMRTGTRRRHTAGMVILSLTACVLAYYGFNSLVVDSLIPVMGEYY